jgi:hypothetical protein
VKVAKNVVGKKDCGGKFCIDKNSPPSELIREINIRLAGFGGNVPTDKFTDRTEKMIKQFQRDYMKVPETGKVCGNVLKAIDEFTNKWVEKINDYKCLCHASDSKVKVADRCLGFGKGKTNEHPGMHRILLWASSTLRFYISQQSEFTIAKISAGYRCWAHNNSVPRTSTNHMGKAVDINFKQNGNLITQKVQSNLPKLKKIRDLIYIKKLNAVEGWSMPNKSNKFRLEPIGTGKDESYSWIHMDVTKFNDYLNDSFFVKSQNEIIGKNIAQLANELGFKDMCNCGGGFKTSKVETKKLCSTCNILEKSRMAFYEEFGNSSINMVQNKGKSNKFKGLYMVAQRRQENSFKLEVPNNNPMNIKGKGDMGSSSLNTHEYINGKKVYMSDGFANFSSVEKGFEGYLELLKRNFNEAYEAILDDNKSIDGFLIGMQDKGRLGAYATDPNYKTSIKNIFNGVVSDYKKWLNCKLNCGSYSSIKAEIEKDIKLLEKLK